MTASLGLLYETSDSVRVGVAVMPGASYTAERTANGPDGTLDAGSSYELRAPSQVSGGVAVRPSPRWLFAGQVDYVRYSEIKPFARPGTFSGPGYEVGDGLEPRLGAEFSWPLSGISLQLRAGAHWQAPGGLRFAGADPVEAATFSDADRRLVGSAGLTVATRPGPHIDLAATTGGEQPELLAGARFRF